MSADGSPVNPSQQWQYPVSPGNEKEFAPHAAHVSAPGMLRVFLSPSTHAVASVDAMRLLAFPDGHCKHSSASCVSMYVPTAHAVQKCTFPSTNCAVYPCIHGPVATWYDDLVWCVCSPCKGHPGNYPRYYFPVTT